MDFTETATSLDSSRLVFSFGRFSFSVREKRFSFLLPFFSCLHTIPGNHKNRNNGYVFYSMK